MVNVTTMSRTLPSGGAELRATIRLLRQEYAAKEGLDPQAQLAPIRAMARMVAATEAECAARKYDPQIARQEIVNRTIGDVNVRKIEEHDATWDYRSLADDLGIALPHENVNGYIASGKTYLALRHRMMLLEEAHSNAASERQPRGLLPLMRQSARLLYTPLRPAK